MENHADPFPVRWDDAEEAQAMWLLDDVHSLHRVSHLDFALRARPMLEGSDKAFALYGIPFKTAPKLVHGRIYQKIVVADLSAEELAGALKAADEAVRRAAAELASRWEKTWLPEIQAHLAALTAFDLRGAAWPALLAHLEDAKRRFERLWEVHFELLQPILVALSDFEEAYRDLFPDARPFDVYDLLAGFPNKTIEANIQLWRLGRAAADKPSVRAIIIESEPAALASTLEQSPDGRALLAEIRRYLSTYGERNDNLCIDAPTWIEEPTPALRGLREAILRPNRDLAEELPQQTRRRESRLGEVRAQLASFPRPVVEEFEALLKAAQAATILSEDHHFWIDCKVTYHARRVALEVGRRLSERGAIQSPADVFELTLEDVSALDAPEAPSADLHARVAERRAEAERYAAVAPPPFLGVPRPLPPMDSAVLKASFKFSGNIMSPPGGQGELRGMPGSRGKVTGPARVVRAHADADKLEPGEILVAPATLPSWTPFFATAAAVVTGTGGILSHAAVVAREYGIPAVVGARGAPDVIRDGQIVEVDGDAGVVRLMAS